MTVDKRWVQFFCIAFGFLNFSMNLTYANEFSLLEDEKTLLELIVKKEKLFG
jgi:hypothetical protein